ARTRRIKMARRRMAQERMGAPAYAGNGVTYREAQGLDVEARPGRSAGVGEYGRQPGAPAPRAPVSAPRGRVEASNGNGNGNGHGRNGSSKRTAAHVDG